MTPQHQQQQQQILQPTGDGRLLALETRVEGVIGLVQSISTAVAELSKKIDSGRQTPWAVIFSAMGVMLSFTIAVGGLAYMPINAGISDLKAALLMSQERSDKRFDAVADKMVSRAEHEREWKSRDDLYAFQRDRIQQMEVRIDKRLDRLESFHFKKAD